MEFKPRKITYVGLGWGRHDITPDDVKAIEKDAMEGIGTGLAYFNDPLYIVHIKSGRPAPIDALPTSEQTAQLAIVRMASLADWTQDYEVLEQLMEQPKLIAQLRAIVDEIELAEAEIESKKEGFERLSLRVHGETPQERLPAFVARMVAEFLGKDVSIWEYRERNINLADTLGTHQMWEDKSYGWISAFYIPGARFWLIRGPDIFTLQNPR